MSTQGFTNKQNAMRAARKLIAKGEAPSDSFQVRIEDGRHVIVWAAPATGGSFGRTPERQATTAASRPSVPSPTEPAPIADAEAVEVALPELVFQGWSTQRPETAPNDTAPVEAEIAAAAAGYQLKALPRPKRARKAAAPSVARGAAKASRYAVAPEALASGQVPADPPVVTSAANKHYQKHFDRLHGFAVAGDWGAVRDYPVKGSNSYAKLVARYRQDLLTLAAAQAAAAE
jgi:hypothetical protein